MPTTLLTTEYRLGLEDSNTGKDIPVIYAVDVSDVCFFHEGGCLLLYGKAERGPLVQLVYPSPRSGAACCVVTHYFLDELEREILTQDSNFHYIAKQLGLHTDALICLLRRWAP